MVIKFVKTVLLILLLALMFVGCSNFKVRGTSEPYASEEEVEREMEQDRESMQERQRYSE